MTRIRAAIALIVAAAVLLVAGPRIIPGLQFHAADPSLAVGVGAIEAPLSMSELTQLADLVVVGTALRDRVVPFMANPAVPAEERDPEMYAKGFFQDVTFDVSEYVKGDGPKTLSVRAFASTPQFTILTSGFPNLEPGKTYALFLETGRGLWVGGYTVLGMRGVGTVANGEARFESSFGTVNLGVLRDTVRNAPPRRR
jgi:hypothetical protein